MRNEFTDGRRREDRKSDNDIWHYIFSYTIQLFIMMPVRTEEFCPDLHPLVSMYAKWRTKLPNAGKKGSVPNFHPSLATNLKKAALVRHKPCTCSCCSASPAKQHNLTIMSQMVALNNRIPSFKVPPLCFNCHLWGEDVLHQLVLV